MGGDDSWRRDVGPFTSHEQAMRQFGNQAAGIPEEMADILPVMMLHEASILAGLGRLSEFEATWLQDIAPEQAVILAGLILRARMQRDRHGGPGGVVDGEVVDVRVLHLVCPACQRVTRNPMDVQQEYCPWCHWWTHDPLLARQNPKVAALLDARSAGEQQEHDGDDGDDGAEPGQGGTAAPSVGVAGVLQAGQAQPERQGLDPDADGGVADEQR